MGDNYLDILTEKIFNDTNEMIYAILNKEVTECQFSETPPIDEALTDSNKVYVGKVSVLFIDMRNSTAFTEKTKKEDAIKTYRSLLKTATYAIRLHGGFVRDYTGDGILAIFCDNEDSTSETKSVAAGRLIQTLICYSLNPILNKELDGISIACGIGISSGDVSITKVGMRGRESDEKAENETGTIWIGSCTNKASKLCSLANPNELIVDEKTAIATDEKWEQETRVNDNKVYDCYLLSDCRIDIADTITQTPLFAKDPEKHTKNVVDEVKKYLLRIQQESEKLGAQKKLLNDKEQLLIRKEQQLNQREQELFTDKANQVDKEKSFNRDVFESYINLLRTVFCKSSIIKETEVSFWNQIILTITDIGKDLDFTQAEIDERICVYAMYIYETLEIWEEAYKYLCLIAKYKSWISALSIKNIIQHSGHWIDLKITLKHRLKSPLDHETYKSLKEGLDKIIEMGY